MNTLIIVATEREIQPFLGVSESERQGVDVLVTGVGMVATAFALGGKLACASYDLLLNVGISGSFDRSIPLGEVVCVDQDTLAELGAEDGEDFLDSALLNLGEHTFEGAHSDDGALRGLRRCRGITVNRVHGNEQTIAATVARLKPDTESMEGAAVFYAARQAGIPALQVRAISNYVERRNRAAWQTERAIDNLNRWLRSFVASGGADAQKFDTYEG